MVTENEKEKQAQRVKLWRLKNRKECPGCGTPVAWDTIQCRACHARSRSVRAHAKTVADVKQFSKSLRWTDHVRALARTLHKFDRCMNCGYDKHVQVCHIRAIASFSDDALLDEINHVDNVVGLCPNCHWEFDHGILQLNKHP